MCGFEDETANNGLNTFKSMRNDKDNLIVNITFEFALEIIEFVEELEGLRKFVLANQLLKSGTSIGANVR